METRHAVTVLFALIAISGAAGAEQPPVEAVEGPILLHSENVDIHLTGRRQLSLEKAGWMGSRLALTDTAGGRTLAEADRSGLFTSAWEMRLSNGPARLVSAGWFNTGYRAVRGGRGVAEVSQVGFCGGGWAVEDDGSLKETDLLFIGLIYHTILRRNAAAAS